MSSSNFAAQKGKELAKLKKEFARVMAWFPVAAAVAAFLYFLIPYGLSFWFFEPTTADREVVTSLLEVETTLMGLLTIGIAIYQGSDSWRRLSLNRPFSFYFGVTSSIAFLVFMLTAVLSALAALSSLHPTASHLATIAFRNSVTFMVVGTLFLVARLSLEASLGFDRSE